MRFFTLLAALLLTLPAAAASQTRDASGTLPQSVDALVQLAEDTDSGQRFASAVAALVRRANEQPVQAAAPTVALLTGIIRGGDQMKRAIAVDALKSLPAQSRQQMVPVLTELIQGGGDTPETRLFVRGLGEIGPQGVSALRELLAAGTLTGRSASRARWYTRG